MQLLEPRTLDELWTKNHDLQWDMLQHDRSAVQC